MGKKLLQGFHCFLASCSECLAHPAWLKTGLQSGFVLEREDKDWDWFLLALLKKHIFVSAVLTWKKTNKIDILCNCQSYRSVIETEYKLDIAFRPDLSQRVF